MSSSSLYLVDGSIKLELRSAHSLLPDTRRALSLGCPVLDGFLRGGGILGRGITEICGEAGAGKTQMCLRLLASASLSCPLQESRAVYVCTEGSARTERLRDIARAHARGIGYGEDEVNSAMGRIFIVDRVDTLLGFFETIDTTVRGILEGGSVSLVVIDSIASLFRGEFCNRDDLSVRRDWFFSISAMLRQLSADHGVPFAITNQVSGAFEAGPDTVSVDGRELRPALGIQWSNCVNARLVLLNRDSRARSCGGVENTDESNSKTPADAARKGVSGLAPRLRSMIVSFSPEWPTGRRCRYAVTPEGLKGIDIIDGC